jgi:hypothetical protein
VEPEDIACRGQIEGGSVNDFRGGFVMFHVRADVEGCKVRFIVGGRMDQGLNVDALVGIDGGVVSGRCPDCGAWRRSRILGRI